MEPVEFSLLLDLPADALLYVCTFLKAPQLCGLAQVCRLLRDICETDALWASVVKQAYGTHSRAQRQRVEERMDAIENSLEHEEVLQQPTFWKRVFKFYNRWPLASDQMHVKRQSLMMYHRSWVRDIIPFPVPVDDSVDVASAESDRFLTCSDDLTVAELDLQNDSVALRNSYPNAHENHILTLEFNQFANFTDPSAIVMASAGSDCRIRLWSLDLATGKLAAGKTLIGHRSLVRTVHFATPDTLVSCAHDSTIRVWDLATGTLRTTLNCKNFDNLLKGLPPVEAEEGPPQFMQIMDFALITPRLAACACSDGSIKIWDLLTGTPQASFGGHKNAVRRVRALSLPEGLNPAGWDVLKSVGTPSFEDWLHSLSPDSANLFPGMSPRQRYDTLLVSCSYDGSIIIWSLATLKLVSCLNIMDPSLGELHEYSSLEVYPRIGNFSNNAILVTGSYDHKVRLWDMNSRQVIRCLSGHAGIPCIAKIWRDRLISVGTDGTVCEWRPRPKTEETTPTLFFHCLDPNKAPVIKMIAAPRLLDELMRLQDRLAHLAHLAQHAMHNQNQQANQNDDFHSEDEDEEDDDDEFELPEDAEPQDDN